MEQKLLFLFYELKGMISQLDELEDEIPGSSIERLHDKTREMHELIEENNK